MQEKDRASCYSVTDNQFWEEHGMIFGFWLIRGQYKSIIDDEIWMPKVSVGEFREVRGAFGAQNCMFP